MRTFEELRALCAARSSLQLGHGALHETGSRFELLNSNEIIRLVGLGDVAWPANDGLNTRPLKRPGLGAVEEEIKAVTPNAQGSVGRVRLSRRCIGIVGCASPHP
jgi:hypothetical protein